MTKKKYNQVYKKLQQTLHSEKATIIKKSKS